MLMSASSKSSDLGFRNWVSKPVKVKVTENHVMKAYWGS
jgi:hypothetical protein